MKVFQVSTQIKNNNGNISIFNSIKTNTKLFQKLNRSFHTINKSLNNNNLKYTNEKKFYYNSKKNIWQRIREIFVKPEHEKLKDIKKKEEYYIPKDEIVFFDRKYLVIDSNQNFRDAIKFLQKVILYPIIGTCSYFFFKALLKFNVLYMLLWGFLSFTFLRINFGINQNKKYIIIRMNLLDSGKECEIHTLERSFISDIKSIRRLELEEGLFLAKNIKDMRKNYIPLSIETRLFLIPLTSIVKNQELLSAISNGKYINTDRKIKDERTIDIDSENFYKH